MEREELYTAIRQADGYEGYVDRLAAHIAGLRRIPGLTFDAIVQLVYPMTGQLHFEMKTKRNGMGEGWPIVAPVEVYVECLLIDACEKSQNL